MTAMLPETLSCSQRCEMTQRYLLAAEGLDLHICSRLGDIGALCRAMWTSLLSAAFPECSCCFSLGLQAAWKQMTSRQPPCPRCHPRPLPATGRCTHHPHSVLLLAASLLACCMAEPGVSAAWQPTPSPCSPRKLGPAQHPTQAPSGHEIASIPRQLKPARLPAGGSHPGHLQAAGG